MLLALLVFMTLSAPAPGDASDHTASDSSFAKTVHALYAQQDADRLRQLLRTTETRDRDLLVRYRLYPLTEDVSIIDDLPAEIDDGTAREHALLAGLWAYRAGTVSVFKAIRYGRRSMRFLENAQALDPLNPYVLLVEGQSLLFRPSMAGGDAEAAAQSFQKLVGVLQSAPDAGISEMEARSWLWLALRECGERDRATSLHEELLAAQPPALYREFLNNPPKV